MALTINLWVKCINLRTCQHKTLVYGNDMKTTGGMATCVKCYAYIRFLLLILIMKYTYMYKSLFLHTHYLACPCTLYTHTKCTIL